jgi:hypothetical protein
MADEEWWTTKDAAAYLEVDPRTIRHYLSRSLPKTHPFPEPERRFGITMVWRPATVIAWAETRPGRGNWGPRKP